MICNRLYCSNIRRSSVASENCPLASSSRTKPVSLRSCRDQLRGRGISLCTESKPSRGGWHDDDAVGSSSSSSSKKKMVTMTMVGEKKRPHSKVSRTVTFENARAGSQVVLEMRPISPDDDERENIFLEKISASSHSFRFFGPKRHFTSKEIKYFTHVDYRDDFALCLIDDTDDEIVAVARYFSLSHDPRSPNHDVVEVAILVSDDFSYFGIGTYLMYQLFEYAALEGKTVAVAEVLKKNQFARKLFDRFIKVFPDSTINFEDDFVEFRMPLVKCSEMCEPFQVLPVSYHDLVNKRTHHSHV